MVGQDSLYDSTRARVASRDIFTARRSVSLSLYVVRVP